MPDALTLAARANHVLVGVLILAGLAFAAIGAAQHDTFYLRLATEALIFGGLALSVDILLGYTGLLSLGQALYFALGAYLSALVLKAVPSFWLALAAGLGAGLVLGLVGGIIAIRVRGVYFALITFGLAQVVAKVVYNNPRARRLGRAARRADHRHRSRCCFGVERVAGRFLPDRAGRHHVCVRRLGLHPRHAVRPVADCTARQRPPRAVSRLPHRVAAPELVRVRGGHRDRVGHALSHAARLRVARAAVLLDLGQRRHHRAAGRRRHADGRALRQRAADRPALRPRHLDRAPPDDHRAPVHGRRDLPATRADGTGAPGGRAPARAQGAAMPAPVLEARDLSISFGGLRAVDGVSFAAARNRITTIIGPNGAGKSTLFNLISGALRPQSGDIFVEGVECTGAPPYRMLAAGVARSFQITNLLFDLPVAENLRLAAQVLERPRKYWLPISLSRIASARVAELLERFGLAHKAGLAVAQLSHGEQRRLEVAVALAGKPKVLMLDEPTQGMSHGDTEDTAVLMRSLAAEVTVLLIEHDIGLVMNLSDHVIVMHQGRKLAEGTPASVRADPAVQTAYFGHA